MYVYAVCMYVVQSTVPAARPVQGGFTPACWAPPPGPGTFCNTNLADNKKNMTGMNTLLPGPTTPIRPAKSQSQKFASSVKLFCAAAFY